MRKVFMESGGYICLFLPEVSTGNHKAPCKFGALSFIQDKYVNFQLKLYILFFCITVKAFEQYKRKAW